MILLGLSFMRIRLIRHLNSTGAKPLQKMAVARRAGRKCLHTSQEQLQWEILVSGPSKWSQETFECVIVFQALNLCEINMTIQLKLA